MRFLRAGALAAAMLVTIGAAGCSSTSTSASTTTTVGSGVTTTTATTGSSSPTTPAAGGSTVNIQGFAFKPSSATFKAGATVTVANMDNTDHSLTAVDGSFDTGIFSSGTKTITLSKPGTYAIKCRIHSFMTGTIVVTS